MTRVNRAGVDLIPNHNLQLQMGDRVTVVGSEDGDQRRVENSGQFDAAAQRAEPDPDLRRHRAPACCWGSIPIAFPGIPQPVKLGLAGGPLVVSILMSRFGPHDKLVTYTTMSANLMLRENRHRTVLLWACASDSAAGAGFVHTVLVRERIPSRSTASLITVLPHCCRS